VISAICFGGGKVGKKKGGDLSNINECLGGSLQVAQFSRRGGKKGVP